MTDAPVDAVERQRDIEPNGKPVKDRRTRVRDASFWSFVTYGGRQLIRFASVMVLAHLIVPEVFGVVAIVRTVTLAIEMLSDIGVKTSIVYHDRGEEQAFLNTAWTMKVIRGFVIWGVICAAAPFIAAFYDEMPQLEYLLPVTGFQSVLAGLYSVSIHREMRRISVWGPMAIVWITSIVNLIVMITWAHYSPTAWALIAGALSSALVQLILSWTILPGPHPRFGFEKQAFHALASFGKWVVVGTFVAFLAMQFPKLFIAKFVPPGLVGVFGIAMIFATVPNRIVNHLSNWVLMPLFAEYGRIQNVDMDQRVKPALRKILSFCVLCATSVCVIAPGFFGYFREAYHAAGPIGVWMGVAMWFWTLQNLPRSLLLAVGSSRSVAVFTWFNTVVTLVAVPLGFWLGERSGFGGEWRPGAEFAIGLANVLGWIGVGAAGLQGGTPTFGGVIELGPAPQLGGIYGAIIGTTLGNVAGCIAGWWACRRKKIRIGGILSSYSLVFLAAVAVGLALTSIAHDMWPHVRMRDISVVVSLVVLAPLTYWVWRNLGGDLLLKRRGQRSGG